MPLLYAITGSIGRASFFLSGQVPYLQLRFKKHSITPHISQITEWKEQFPQTRIIINDTPSIAEQTGAWGVHLGQEDIQQYHPKEFQNTSFHLGISVHSWEEMEVALQYSPSYLGFGPIFSTTTKHVKFPPQGTEKLSQFVQKAPCPIVAIGGITTDNLQTVIQAQPHAIAMISGLEGIHDHLSLQQLKQNCQ